MTVLSFLIRTIIFLSNIAVAATSSLLSLPASSQQTLDTGSSLRAVLRDAETAAGLATSGKLFYDADSYKETWSKYCSNSIALANRGEFRKAVREASKALYIGQSTNNSRAMTFASRDLAYAYSLAGDLERAEDWAKLGLSHANNTRLGRDSGSVLGAIHKVLGDIALRRDKHELAIKSYETALSYLLGGDRLRDPAKISMANAQIRRGNIDAAQQILDDIGAVEGDLAPYVARAHGQLALTKRDYKKATEYFTAAIKGMRGNEDAYHLMWMQYGLGQAHAASGDNEMALSSMREAVASAQQLRSRFRSSEFRTGFFGDVQSIYDAAIGFLVDAKRFDEALALSEDSRARAFLDILRGRAKDGQLDTAQAVAKIPLNTMAAIYHVLSNRTIVWMVRAEATDAAVIPAGRKEISAHVERLRRAILNRSADALTLSRNLHALLIQPLGLKPGETLIVVPHKSLHYLPFQALSGSNGYLIEERPVATVPSLNAMLAIVESGAGAKAAMLAMGNPDLENPALALPGAEKEVKNIGTIYPEAKIFVRQEANKSRFLSQAPGNGLIHIAAHATIDEIDPIYSSIRLARAGLVRGEVEAREIMGMDLSAARMVVLSACDSGLGKVSGGDEFFGFKRSFLAAGARTLLVSLWSVEDESTANLMSTFYRELRNRSIIESLRQAQLELIKSTAYADPMFWAPFTLVGAWQ